MCVELHFFQAYHQFINFVIELGSISLL